MLEYDICYKEEAFTKTKGYMYPATPEFRKARSDYEGKLQDLNAWEFNINRETQQEQYEDCIRCIRDLRLRIWIDETPFLVDYEDVRAYYTPSNEKWTLAQMLYTKGKNETLFVSNRKAPNGSFRYFFMESSHYEGDVLHKVFREIPQDEFQSRL